MVKQFPEYLDYITPDGLTYHFNASDRFLVGDPENFGMPDIEYITQQGPMQHGQTVVDYRLKPRVVQLLQRVDQCNRYDYWASRASLIDYMRPNRQTLNTLRTGKLRKYLPNGEIINLDCLISQGPTFGPKDSGTWDEWGYTETLRFIAFDPTWYSNTESYVTWSTNNVEELVFPIDFPIHFDVSFNNSAPITYMGTWLTFPSIDIIGPLNDFIIYNLDTAEQIKLNYNVPNGRRVYIELPYGNKRVIDDAGNDLTGTVDNFGDLATFHIEPAPGAPGGLNNLRVTGTGIVNGISSVVLRYNTRYIGR